MKVMLVVPKFETHIVTPPLGLGYLASSLRESGHEVILLDCLLRNINQNKFAQIVNKTEPDFVGINAMTTYYSIAQDYAKEATRLGITTCLGGPHITARPRESLKESEVDFVMVGESENTIVELVNSLENNNDLSKVKGIGFKKDEKIVLNERRELIKNLDEIPLPAWDLMLPKEYPPAPHGAVVKKFPVAPIITTRGCPFDCSFCASSCIWQRKLRFRSSKNVVDEIEMLANEYGVREFHFEDDNFTTSKKYAMDICNGIIKRKLGIVWACPNGVRIDRLDRELLERMKKSGCYLLSFGIESASQEILHKANKLLDITIVSKTLKMVKDSRIETWGFFIIGLPGETKETALKTINFAKEAPLDRAQFCIFTPLPGSAAFDQWVKDKKIENFNWERFNFFTPVFTTDALTDNDLKELQKEAFRVFYFRPKTFLNFVKRIKPRQFRWLLKRVLQYKLFEGDRESK